MADNKTLRKAKMQKKDEFYTQLSDIENELRHYKAHFKDKVVFCNCDDPYESNFFKYFALNFNALGLKKLITTCYATSPVTGNEFPFYVDKKGQICFFSAKNSIPLQETGERKPYKVEITKVTDANRDGRTDLADVEFLMRNKKNTMILLEGNGDFRSPECVELLKEADIIVTNPPFSLFREYVAQLIEHEKKFIIIGNMNAIHYKEIFPLIKDNKMWIGVSIHSGDRKFNVPDDYPLDAAGCGVDADGRKYIRVKGVRWFTNLDTEKRHEEMLLFKHYEVEKYPTYENFDAIDISAVADIPCDYYGNMGVPDTFMDRYNHDQFEIVGLAESELGGSIGFSANFTEEQCAAFSKECKSFRKGNPIFRDRDGKLHKPYSRIIIRRKQVNPNED